MNRNQLISYALCFCTLLMFSCKKQTKINFDDYEFYIESKYKLNKEQNDENVLLTLNAPKGGGIIIQNKLNILKTTLFKRLDEIETLKSMHTFKFDQFIKELNGYNVEEMELKKIGEIPFSFQTFNYMENGIEVIYDLRILQLKDDFYSFYSLGKSEKKSEILEVTDGIIKSISKENIEINQ